MRMVLKYAVGVALLVFIVGAFSTGSAAYRITQNNDQSRRIALYGSALRIAGRSPLAASTSNLAKQADLRPLDTFSNVERRLRANYYEKIDDSSKLAFGTADNMLDSLDDPYSRLLEPAQLKAYADRQAGEYAGIGAVLAARRKPVNAKGQIIAPTLTDADRKAMPAYDDPVDINSLAYDVVVIATVPGGPAAAAGVRPGDVIRQVGDKLVFARNLDSLDQMLLTPREGSVKLSVTRAGIAKPLEFTMPFRVTHWKPVSGRTMAGIGILSVHSVGPGTADAIQAQLKEMEAAHVRGIVLDLRENGEGDYDEACAVVSQFVSAGNVAKFKNRGGAYSLLPADSRRAIAKLPRVAVLTNATTSGPAELIAAGLKARGAARLFGSTTFGHGSVQELFRVSGGSGVLLTTKLFYAPVPGDAGMVDGVGVTPDVRVPASEGAQDATLLRALAWLKNGAA